MNDETQIDPDHPWVMASTIASPQPVMSSITLDMVTLSMGEDESEAALLTIVDPTGVKTVFLPPQTLHQLLLQGSAIMKDWVKQQEEQGSGLIVGNKENMEQAKNLHKQNNHLRGL